MYENEETKRFDKFTKLELNKLKRKPSLVMMILIRINNIEMYEEEIREGGVKEY